MTPTIIRMWFYSAVCFVSLVIAAYASHDIITYVLKVTVLKETDKYYSASMHSSSLESAEDEVKNERSRRQTMLAYAIPKLLINVPIFLVSYRKLRAA
jgi:hypothetical protein